MAAQSEAADTTDRRFLVTALALLGAVTGAAFGRVFVGTASAVELALAGVLAVLVAAAFERRHLALALGVGALALLEVLALLVFPRTTWAGIPTLDTARGIIDVLSRVSDRAAQEVAPARALPSLMTASLIAVWAAGTASHALAVRARSAVLPLLPPAALLAFAGVVSKDGSRPGYALAFLAASFCVLYAEARVLTASWGPVLQPGRRRSATAGRWARGLGLGAAAVALAAPGVLPGFRSEPILEIDRPSGRVTISPIVDIRPSLLQNPPARLFQVTASRPSYWRMVSLDLFDGRLWRASNLLAKGGDEIDEQTDVLAGPIAPDALTIEQAFVIDDLAVPWLPAAYRPHLASVEGGSARFDPASAILSMEEPTEEGQRYVVSSNVAIPSRRELERVDPRPYVDLDETDARGLARYTRLPPTVPPRIYSIAGELAAGADTAFQELLALQDHLRTFTYDELAPAGHGVNDMLFFLERSRTGYCEQFAGTMAVLARALGYPARVAVGFQPGIRDRQVSNRYVVTSDMIHAWTEVYFAQYGWLAFEPTPTRTNPTANYLTEAPAGIPAGGTLGPGGASGLGSLTGAEFRESFQNPLGPVAPPAPGPGAATPERSPWRPLLLAAAAMFLVVLLLIPPLKALLRSAALRRARSPRESVVTAYRVLQAEAAEIGLGRRAGETLGEYRSRLSDSVRFSDGHLERLTGLTDRALYSRLDLLPEDGREARAATRAVMRDLRRHAGPARVTVGAFRPSRPL
jgi:TgpA N-terminal domain/Transglutaminase-like superfamily